MECKSEEDINIRPFRFQNFWIKHHQFKKIVTENWKADFVGSPAIEFQAKLKRVRRALVRWNREAFGNIFQKMATLEDTIKVKKLQFELQPSPGNKEELKKMEADLRKWLKDEEVF